MNWLYSVLATVALVSCEKNQTRKPSQQPLVSSPQVPTPSGTIVSQNPKTYEIRDALMRAGFPNSDLATMLCIGWCESKFDTNAVSDEGAPNNASRYNWGVFQINGVNITSCGYTSGQQLLNLQANAKCALKVRQSQGLSAWTTYSYCQQPPSDPTKARCS